MICSILGAAVAPRLRPRNLGVAAIPAGRGSMDPESDGRALHPLRINTPRRIGTADNAKVADTDSDMVFASSYFAPMLRFNSGKIALGGHRGMGANTWDAAGPSAPQKYRENTIMSFHAAAAAGATFVEFDVQVTADGVPIIFHDNYIVFGDSASPTSSMVKHMSLDDFRSLAPINSCSDLATLAGCSDDDTMSTAAMPLGYDGNLAFIPLGASPPRGSSPVGGSPRNGGLMRKHQNDMPALPFEPSLHPWEAQNEDALPSLAEVFAALPLHIAFDIEIKMTTPCDVERTPAEEVHRVVEATLRVVDASRAAHDNGPTRPIMFSSFDPEVCVEIKTRRPQYHVMFLTGGGAYPHVDPRRTTIEAAIRFAAEEGLQGIIVESLTLYENQEWIQHARQRGLHVLSYGLHNNNVKWVAEQEALGVHGVIVDDVASIAKAFAQ